MAKSPLDTMTAERDALRAGALALKEEVAIVRTQLTAATSARDAAIKNVATLKELLHAAEMETARLNGYLGRVHESDDAISDMVSVPQAAPLQIQRSKLARDGVPFSDGGYRGGYSVADEKQKHWTSL